MCMVSSELMLVTTTDTAGGGGGVVGVTKYGRGPRRRFRYVDPLVLSAALSLHNMHGSETLSAQK